MTGKMTKEEAKKEFDQWFNPKDFPNRPLVVYEVNKLIDAIEPDKLYRVKVYGLDLPAMYYRKRDDGTLTFVQGGAGLRETGFTMDEIKLRQLENCERKEVTDDAD